MKQNTMPRIEAFFLTRRLQVMMMTVAFEMNKRKVKFKPFYSIAH
jgi:hypothetical protein